MDGDRLREKVLEVLSLLVSRETGMDIRFS